MTRGESAPSSLPDRGEPGSLALGVGDLVVYASHGVGRVESSCAGGGDLSETIVLGFDSGLRITLPHARGCAGLRPLSGADALEDVRRALGDDAPASTESWSRRFRTLREKVAGGSVTELAEVVRDGVRRERSVVATKGRPAAPSERELYRQARRLLAAEVAAARGIDADAADAWIVEQVCGEPVAT